MECRDRNCPEHGELATRGMTLLGRVVSDKMQKTITVKVEYTVKVPKYERFKRKHTKIKAHKPDCIDVKVGDIVHVAECRPLSKSVHFVVTRKETSADALKEKALPVEVEKPKSGKTGAKEKKAEPKKAEKSPEPKPEKPETEETKAEEAVEAEDNGETRE